MLRMIFLKIRNEIWQFCEISFIFRTGFDIIAHEVAYEKKSKSFIELHVGRAGFQRRMRLFFWKSVVDVYRCSVDPQSGSACRGTGWVLIHGGYFDFMTYSFSSAKNLLTRHPEAQPQRYFDYAQKQKERRGTSEHFLLKLSGILLGLSILLTILYEVI